ncbi:MAG: RDD family protein [Cyclobacteriaceae bacterium]
MKEKDYPGLVERIKAIVIDWIVILIFMALATFLFSKFESVSDNARKIAFVFIFFLYEPIFISLFGGTLGHKMNGLAVKRSKNSEKNILLPLAIIRFTIKSFLGLVSLFTVMGNSKKQAIHDLMVGSVVVYSR